jgi:hypothetical protein
LVSTFEIKPRGPFSLAAAQSFAGGFPSSIGGGAVGATSIAMAFPVEGTDSSAAVQLSQRADGVVVGRTDAPTSLIDQVKRQAARSLSLDHDGSGWPDVGKRDPIIGRLQEAHDYLRPVCFYSAYEAAMDGRLNTDELRGVPHDEAIARLLAMPGVGPFTAEAVLLRGCSVADDVPSSEEMSLQAAADLYDKPGLDRAGYLELAEKWRPYRMWAVLLLRVGWNRERGTRSYRQPRR